MEWITRYQLFLFDFDGLLVDTERLHFLAYIEMCANRGFKLTWNFEQFCEAAHFKSFGLKDAIYEEFPGLYAMEPRWEILYQEKREAYERLLENGKLELMPGVEVLLTKLEQRGIRRCVVTNSPRKQIDRIKRFFPVLDTIPLWITREDYNLPKPAPDGYLKAIEVMGQPGDQIIGFEDSMKGLQALLAAGVEGILICPNNLPQVAECAQLGVDHFETLLEVPSII